MVQGIAAECMHNSDQSIEKGVRSLNIYDFYTISIYESHYHSWTNKTMLLEI